jgi:hypothetical protein
VLAIWQESERGSLNSYAQDAVLPNAMDECQQGTRRVTEVLL